MAALIVPGGSRAQGQSSHQVLGRLDDLGVGHEQIPVLTRAASQNGSWIFDTSECMAQTTGIGSFAGAHLHREPVLVCPVQRSCRRTPGTPTAFSASRLSNANSQTHQVDSRGSMKEGKGTLFSTAWPSSLQTGHMADRNDLADQGRDKLVPLAPAILGYHIQSVVQLAVVPKGSRQQFAGARRVEEPRVQGPDRTSMSWWSAALGALMFMTCRTRTSAPVAPMVLGAVSSAAY